jgi:hypothetical protein
MSDLDGVLTTLVTVNCNKITNQLYLGRCLNKLLVSCCMKDKFSATLESRCLSTCKKYKHQKHEHITEMYVSLLSYI